MSAQKQVAKLAVSAMAFDNIIPTKILLIQRGSNKATAQPRLWSFPGGHLEFGEQIDDGVLRELREETGYRADMMQPSIININEVLSDNYHFVILSKCCVYTSICPNTEKENLVQCQFYLDRYQIPISNNDHELKLNDQLQRISTLKPENCIDNFFQILDGVMFKQFGILLKN